MLGDVPLHCSMLQRRRDDVYCLWQCQLVRQWVSSSHFHKQNYWQRSLISLAVLFKCFTMKSNISIVPHCHSNSNVPPIISDPVILETTQQQCLYDKIWMKFPGSFLAKCFSCCKIVSMNPSCLLKIMLDDTETHLSLCLKQHNIHSWVVSAL